MKFRMSLFSLLLATGLLGTLTTGAYADPPADDSSNNTVKVEAVIQSGGGFDAYFCTVSVEGSEIVPSELESSPLMAGSDPTANQHGLATGLLWICYEDTMNYRPNFDTQVSASQFESDDALTHTPISAQKFKIKTTYNVLQVQGDGDLGSIDVGDIGSFGETGYVGQNTLPATWGGNARSLNEARTVQFGYAGAGTILSVGIFQVELEIPAGTAPGTYESTMTLTIMPGTR